MIGRARLGGAFVRQIPHSQSGDESPHSKSLGCAGSTTLQSNKSAKYKTALKTDKTLTR